MKKAWERERDIIQNAVPCYLQDDNEVFWEEQNNAPEQAQDALAKLHFHSRVPGSRAEESICTAAVQATENKGLIVENSEWLLEQGLAACDSGDTVAMHKYEQAIFNACYSAKKDETHPYWQQTFYDTFEDYDRVTEFPSFEVDIAAKGDAYYAGWLAQIVGGAYGTCIEGYTGRAIKQKYGGELTRYVRKPNTYNDDNTYELALLLAYKEHGKATTALDIANEWTSRIPTGWSAEEWALNHLKCGILPPESGSFHNPFSEWIGAQMRGAICGQLYPGNLREAARCAWMDASISHARNGILGEVFNALLVSMSFAESDVRKILETCIGLIPADSEYGTVVRFALEQCRTHDNYADAWQPCEEKYIKYNWIHAYPNACAEVIALWYGNGDFEKTLSACGGCGQDVDCNAAQIMTAIGTISGPDAIPAYWKEPFGDELITYVRGLKKLSIRGLAELTQEVALSLR
ncbi:MAG: ADP-ribosylglycohydrolase family protein [Clostridia bacterium]|nr:ADP-ribosylglycohydrolase family protein [Clostridia bacterium]